MILQRKERIQGCTLFDMEKIVIKKPKNLQKKSMYCEICDAVLVNSLDILSSDKNGCCEMCRIKWVEPRKELYASGWRPTKEEVALEMEKRKSLPLSFTV